MEINLEKHIQAYLKAQHARDAPWKKLETLLENFKNSDHPSVKTISCLEEFSKQHQIMLYYVGGFLRDLWLGCKPRDIDIVFHENSMRTIEYVFADYLERKNRFGGLKLRIEGFPVDMWPLQQTSYFQAWKLVTDPVPEDRMPIIPAIPNFPKTTFFSAESAMLEVFRYPDHIYSDEGATRLGWEDGFFKACEQKMLEIQPSAKHDTRFVTGYPDYQIVRTHQLQKRLRWILGDRLKLFLKETLPKTSPDKLAEIYCQHYELKVNGREVHNDIENLIR